MMTTLTSSERSRHGVNGAHDETQRYDIVVIGGGQAGLATGYYLAQRGLRFVILDAHERTGNAWRARWDSLVLFTPAKYSRLPGMPLAGSPLAFPTKDQVADYLESYAATMKLPIRHGTVARAVRRTGSGGWVVDIDGARLEADAVVIATGGFQAPRIPAWAAEIDTAILQLHSSAYRNPSQLRPGPVLVVGASHSGAEIAVEVAGTHHTILAGRDTGQVPFPSSEWTERVVGPLIWFMVNRVLTHNTPIGRKAKRQFRAHGFPLERTRRPELAAAGVDRITDRVTGAANGKPMLADGRVLDVDNVIWCTGFTGSYAWIEGVSYGDDGFPEQDHGAAADATGLYFVGLKFQTRAASSLIGGVGRDARTVVGHIAAQTRRAT